jgi:hypothetical protein
MTVRGTPDGCCDDGRTSACGALADHPVRRRQCAEKKGNDLFNWWAVGARAGESLDGDEAVRWPRVRAGITSCFGRAIVVPGEARRRTCIRDTPRRSNKARGPLRKRGRPKQGVVLARALKSRDDPSRLLPPAAERWSERRAAPAFGLTHVGTEGDAPKPVQRVRGQSPLESGEEQTPSDDASGIA